MSRITPICPSCTGKCVGKVYGGLSMGKVPCCPWLQENAPSPSSGVTRAGWLEHLPQVSTWVRTKKNDCIHSHTITVVVQQEPEAAATPVKNTWQVQVTEKKRQLPWVPGHVITPLSPGDRCPITTALHHSAVPFRKCQFSICFPQSGQIQDWGQLMDLSCTPNWLYDSLDPQLRFVVGAHF